MPGPDPAQLPPAALSGFAHDIDEKGPDIASTDSSPSLLERICSACLEQTSATAIAVAVVNAGGHRGTAYASDELAARAEDLGFMLGEGPAADAFTTSGPVLVNELSAAEWRARWPAFAAAALDLGAASIFAFPLQLGAIVIGTLTLYGRTAGQLDGRALTSTLRAADDTVLALLQAMSGEPADELDEGVFRTEVYQASGMLAEQLQVTVVDALVRLRAHAYATGSRVDEVARAVVRRELRFVDDNEQAPPEKGSDR